MMAQPCLPGFDHHRVTIRELGKLTVHEIQTVVADFYRLPVGEMISARRAQCVTGPRQVAMYLARELTPKSLPVIGRHFGNRDHTTVLHAIRQVEKRCAENDEIRHDVECLKEALS